MLWNSHLTHFAGQGHELCIVPEKSSISRFKTTAHYPASISITKMNCWMGRYLMGYGSNFIVCLLCKISLLCKSPLCVEPVVDFMVLQMVKTSGLVMGACHLWRKHSWLHILLYGSCCLESLQSSLCCLAVWHADKIDHFKLWKTAVKHALVNQRPQLCITGINYKRLLLTPSKI